MNVPPSNTGGWLFDLSERLFSSDLHSLVICFPISKNKHLISGQIRNIVYYGIPFDNTSSREQDHISSLLQRLMLEETPDIIHIWGTESLHSYCAALASSNLGLLDRTIVSIQGLISIYAEYYLAEMPLREYLLPTLKEFCRRTSLRKEQKKFEKRGLLEKECLKLVPHVIGRTDWDRACTRAINPNLIYWFCNESLRPIFYQNSWAIKEVQRNSLFFSQAHYPLKGFHKILEAAAILVSEFPDLVIYCTGKDRCDKHLKNRLSFSTYDRYISHLIRKYKLENHVRFLGTLTEKEMCQRYLRSHVFVSASSIENSSNSIGEAMLLGVPIVASDVGGTKNLLTHEKDGLVYPFADQYTLAEYIRRIFLDDELAIRFSQNARTHALRTHDRDTVFQTILHIYDTISQHGTA